MIERKEGNAGATVSNINSAGYVEFLLITVAESTTIRRQDVGNHVKA